MARCSRIQNPICQLQTVTILYTLAFVITRHSRHRCVYIMFVIIFFVVACTITFFIKTYLLSPFLIIFWWIGNIFDHVIFRSTSKAFPRVRSKYLLDETSTAWAISLSFLNILKNNSAEWLLPPKKMHFAWTECALSLCLLNPELLLSRFR